MNSKILHAALFCPAPGGFWGLPILGEGHPGTGKTAFIEDAAARSGLHCKRLSPAEMGEGMFGCVPVPREDGFLHFPSPDWSKEFVNGGVIFIDEISSSPPAIQAPLLGFVQRRTLGSYTFPKRTRVLAAANATVEAAGGWDLAPPLANRFGHFEFEGLSAPDYGVALMGNFVNMEDSDGPTINAEAEEARVLAAWPGAMAWACGIIAGFILRRPALLHAQPKTSDKKASKAWPSHRSWHHTAVAMASARVHGLSEIDTDTFMAGFVGLAAVTELRTWIMHVDLPEPADVLDGKVQWKHDARRLDRTIAVLGACAGLVAPDKAEKKKERGNRCWDLIGTVLDTAADCAIPATRVLRDAKMVKPTEYPSYLTIGHKLLPILTQAGLIK